MNDTVITHKKKKKLLLELFSSIDKRRKYTFYITSCYFRQHSADVLIREVADMVNLESVEIYIDKKEASKIGKDILLEWLSGINKRFCFDISLYPVKTNYLFHAKSYSLISWVDEDINNGQLIAGSANLTGAGLTSNKGNIEILVDTKDRDIISTFYESLCNLNYQEIEDLEKFNNIDSFDFKYSLLQSGYFIHTWDGSLNQELCIKYRLSKEGKKRIQGDPALDELGFSVSQATVSKSYFDFDFSPPLTEYERNIKLNYGIATFLGHWIPKVVVDEIFGDDNFDVFKDKFLNKIKEDFDLIIPKIDRDFQELKSLNLIEINDKDPVEIFKEKIEKLKHNDVKLWRIYSKYEIIELPYDFSQREEITELYENFTETYENKRNNKASLAIYEVLEEKDLSPLSKIL